MQRIVMPCGMAILSAALAFLQAAPPSTASQHALVDQYCSACHNDQLKSGAVTLTKLDLAHPDQSAELAEKAIRKVRAGLMPPAGMPRPDQTAVNAFANSLETEIDRASAAHPNPGRPSLHRLTHALRVLAIRVISLSGLHSQIFALHLQLDVMIAGGRAVFVGCITHAVLGS